jgi:LruC domain-containing protein
MRTFSEKILLLSIVTSLLFIVNSCKRENTITINDTNSGEGINSLKIPNGFNFETTRLKKIKLTFLNPQGNVHKNIIVTIMDNSYELNGKVLAKGRTNEMGVFETLVEVPLSLNNLVVNSTAYNIPRDVLVLNNDNIVAYLGGPNYNPQTVVNPKKIGKTNLGKLPGKLSTKLGTWNTTDGKPNYLETDDILSSGFMTSINSLFVNRVSLPNRFPLLLDDNFYRRNILTTDQCDVFITFVKEGAGNLNSLFYYTYNVNYPPALITDIDSIILVFPNTSFSGSGGNLSSGNKVKIGSFGKDTVIAFGILSDGFDASNGTIKPLSSIPAYYGNKSFNPEVNDAFRQHLVMFYEPTTKRIVFAFEDINRNPGGSSDNDFDDVVYYASVNNISSINLDKIPEAPGTTDTDGDGIDDNNDDYPTDGTKAFNNFFPASNRTATVAYEDLWYYKGDYDMNDVVMDMRTNAITNANNKLVRFEANYCLRASGGSLKTAFVVNYPILRSKITGLSGGTVETDKSNAVIRIYDDVRANQATWNTVPGSGYNDSVNFNLSFNFVDSTDLSAFGVSLHDPFIWINEVNRGRAYEIHLPGKSPTSTATNPLIGLGDDDTQLLGTKKYLSKNNLPWAIAIPERFNYPSEKQDITQTYLKFAAWSQSGGTINRDWYYNLPNYRDNSKIYVRP